MVEAEKQIRLYDLRLDSSRSDLYKRFTREYRGPFRYRPDISGKLEILQAVQIPLGEYSLGSQERNVLVIEMKILYIVDEQIESARDSKTAIIRDSSEKHIEIQNVIRSSGFIIAVRHGVFIKVGYEFFLNESSHSYCPSLLRPLFVGRLNI